MFIILSLILGRNDIIFCRFTFHATLKSKFIPCCYQSYIDLVLPEKKNGIFAWNQSFFHSAFLVAKKKLMNILAKTDDVTAETQLFPGQFKSSSWFLSIDLISLIQYLHLNFDDFSRLRSTSQSLPLMHTEKIMHTVVIKN